jgi:ATP-dependent Clp protease ATP-binding subunit ClpA
MRRTIEQAVENPLAAMLVRAEIKSGNQVVVGLSAEALTFEIKHKGAS